MNPTSMIKIMKAKNAFTKEHPKFVAFLKYVLAGGIVEDTVIEITVTKPGMEPVASNIKVSRSDLELFDSLKGLSE